MEERRSVQRSNTSKSTIHTRNNSDGSLFNSDTEKLDETKAAVIQAKDLMKDFSDPSNLYGFKLLVEDLRLKLPSKILINALKLLSDVSLFDYYTEDIISHFELHLRTWVATLERVVCSSIASIFLNQEFYDKLYSSLVSFIDIHYHITLFFKQEVDLDIAGDNYLHFQNYNVNFLLIHLRDSLHSIRNNKTRSDEFLKQGKDFLLSLIRTIPNGDSSVNILEILGGSPVTETLPKLNGFFNLNNSIPKWYQKWREFLFIHYSLEDLIRDSNHSILKHHNEAYILEFLWQYIFDPDLNQNELDDDVSEILGSQEEFSSLFIEYRLTDLPYFLWFGILDFAQNLCQKISQPSILTFFYHLGLKVLKKSQFDYIQFKSLELLLSLSYKEPEWFESLVNQEINKYCDSLSKDSLQKFKILVDNVNLKLRLDNKFIKHLTSTTKFKESWLFKEKLSARKSDTLFKEIIIEQLTCPITGEVTNDFLILGCNHLISYNAIRTRKIIFSMKSRSFKCPFCKTVIKLESIYKLSRNATLKGLCKPLEQIGYSMEKQQMSIKMDVELKISPSKVTLPTFNRAIKALRQHEYSTAIIWLTRILHFYPKSYSIRCKRAFASWKIEMYPQALNDLTIAIRLRPTKSLAYIYRCHMYFFLKKDVDALNDLEAALRIDPDNITAHLYKAKICSDKKKFHEAQFEIRKVLHKINFAHPILSILFEKFDKPHKMIFGLGNSLPIRLYNTDHATISGYILLQSCNNKEIVMSCCVQAINNDDKNVIAIGIKGILYYTMGSFGKALVCFQEILNIFPSTIALDCYEKTYQTIEKHNERWLKRVNKMVKKSLNQTNTFNSCRNEFNLFKDQDEHFLE
ncbi:22375_t:CDS:2 [Dentiscutata erythropus]|uniref:22375_t:CDS:1 n=1 Tax=Dentiscutata erythropus TaxID=1348616 RepID=A0A9N9G2M3_9GLOM|nr:22375_t:CDS:2 [Dentiscutata erythropus]